MASGEAVLGAIYKVEAVAVFLYCGLSSYIVLQIPNFGEQLCHICRLQIEFLFKGMFSLKEALYQCHGNNNP